MADNDNTLKWLPPYRELHYEQTDFLDKYKSPGRRIVYGPAGSGKTVITLYSIKTLADEKINFVLFVFTNVLLEFIRVAAKDLGFPEGRVLSFYGWALGQHREMLGRGLSGGEDQFDELVDSLIRYWEANPHRKPHFAHIYVDEAQDFKPNVAKLLNLLTANLHISADPAQSLYVDNTDLKQLLKRWHVEESPLLLMGNYRNSKPIARLASLFLTDARVSKESFVERVRNLLNNTKPSWHEVESKERAVDKIADILRANRGEKRIAILFRFRKDLETVSRRLEEQRVKHQVALSGKDATYNFNLALPVLTTIHSAKGLEFDEVILPELNRQTWEERTYGEPIELERLLFVGITRAKSGLHLISVKGMASKYLDRITSHQPSLVQTPGAGSSPPIAPDAGAGDDFPF